METENNEIHHQECLVAHIDILGAKNLIKEDEKGFVSTLLKIIDDSKKILLIYNKEKVNIYDYKLKIFSDNICLYTQLSKGNPLYNQKKHDIIAFFIQYIATLQYIALTEYKVLLRGGIAKGNLFVNDDLIIGTSLIDAYLLESEKANYSRTIISDDIMKEHSEKKYSFDNMVGLTKKDDDGFFMVNYLIYSDIIKNGKSLSENLKMHQSILREKFAKAEDELAKAECEDAKKACEKIKNKILLLIKYHNIFCKELKEDSSLLIELPH